MKRTITGIAIAVVLIIAAVISGSLLHAFSANKGVVAKGGDPIESIDDLSEIITAKKQLFTLGYFASDNFDSATINELIRVKEGNDSGRSSEVTYYFNENALYATFHGIANSYDSDRDGDDSYSIEMSLEYEGEFFYYDSEYFIKFDVLNYRLGLNTSSSLSRAEKEEISEMTGEKQMRKEIQIYQQTMHQWINMTNAHNAGYILEMVMSNTFRQSTLSEYASGAAIFDLEDALENGTIYTYAEEDSAAGYREEIAYDFVNSSAPTLMTYMKETSYFTSKKAIQIKKLSVYNVNNTAVRLVATSDNAYDLEDLLEDIDY